VGRSIQYNHVTGIASASECVVVPALHNKLGKNRMTKEIYNVNYLYFKSLAEQLDESHGRFVTKTFNNPHIYKLAKKELLNAKTVVFIDNCVVPQQFVWDNFEKCWESIVNGKRFDWWECFISSLPVQIEQVKLPFDFSIANHQKLNEYLEGLPHIWITANRIAVEDNFGNRLYELCGTGRDYPWF